MQREGVPRSLATVVSVALVALVGAAACADSAVPLLDQTPGPNEQLIGTWSSTAYGSPHTETVIPEAALPVIPRPDGWSIGLRGRCTGAGELTVRISATASGTSADYGVKCTGKWQGGSHDVDGSSGEADRRDQGPVTVMVDRADTIASWDLEAYAIRVTGLYTRRASPSPT